MKPANRIPLSERESSRLYRELSRRGAFCSGERYPWRYEKLTGEELLTLAIRQSQYDPRLLTILIDFFRSKRPEVNPLLLKETLRREAALPIMAVIAEFVLEFPLPIQVREFLLFLMAGVKPVPTQLFFRNLYPIGGKKMEEAARQPLWAFKKWGFLAADPPLLKERLSGERPYLFDRESRMQILGELTKDHRQFRLKDYLKAIGSSITRQQALKDLRSTPWIRKRGIGRGTVYEAKTSKP